MIKTFSVVISSVGMWVSAFAGTGSLFTVTASAPQASVEFILCLNAKGPLSCQRYQANGINLKIDSNIKNRTYPFAGIKINTPGYNVSGCTPLANGYCLFSVNGNQSAFLTLDNPNNPPPISTVGFYETLSGSSIIRAISYYTNDYGKNWITSTAQPIDGANNITMLNVKCARSGHCVSVGIDNTVRSPIVFTSNDGGNRWTKAATQPTQQGNGTDDITISCDEKGVHCIATTNYNNNGNITLASSYVSTDGGQNWAASSTQFPTPPPQTPSVFLASIDCSSDGLKCAGVGYYTDVTLTLPTNASYFTTDGGQSWIASTIQPATQGTNSSMTSVACDSSGLQCTAIGSYVNGTNNQLISSYTSSNGGQTWVVSNTQPFSPAGTGDILSSVSCNSGGLKCAAVGAAPEASSLGFQPLAYYSIDGGKNWILSPGQPPAQAIGAALTSVVCDGALCSAVGSNDVTTGGQTSLISYYSIDSGQNWALSNAVPAPQGGDASNFLYGIG